VKILCVCDRGHSRSPTIASLLRERGHDTLSCGVDKATFETRKMLSDWCELAIFTDAAQIPAFPDLNGRAQVWPIADVYPRPYNKDLHALALRMIASKGL
jgi:hypothetical protein